MSKVRQKVGKGKPTSSLLPILSNLVFSLYNYNYIPHVFAYIRREQSVGEWM